MTSTANLKTRFKWMTKWMTNDPEPSDKISSEEDQGVDQLQTFLSSS